MKWLPVALATIASADGLQALPLVPSPGTRAAVARPRGSLPQADQSLSSSIEALPDVGSLHLLSDIDLAVIRDTAADVAVYTLLAGVAGLTVYSVYVTLDESNKKAGGWERRDEGDAMPTIGDDVQSRLRSGAVFDPVTEQWTYPNEVTPGVAPPPRARASPTSDGDEGNRYDRRMARRTKKKKSKK